MPRYVILSHDHPFPHWDLMLECGDALRTWRLADLPEAGKSVVAELLGDHRLAYLDYEGPVSGGRGSVKRWDRGAFEWLEHSAESVSVAVRGEQLQGQLDLRRTETGNWNCAFAPLA